MFLRISKHQLHGRECGGGGHLDIGVHLLHHAGGQVQQLGRIGDSERAMDLRDHLGQFVEKGVVAIYLFWSGRPSLARSTMAEADEQGEPFPEIPCFHHTFAPG